LQPSPPGLQQAPQALISLLQQLKISQNPSFEQNSLNKSSNIFTIWIKAGLSLPNESSKWSLVSKSNFEPSIVFVFTL
jgi:hypothetical protein